MSKHHCPMILSHRHGAYFECRCGVLGKLRRDRGAASIDWALHVAASLVPREGVEPSTPRV